MPANPYAPPAHHDVQTSSARQRALWCLRVALVILLLPALFNYYAFNTSWQAAGPAARFRDSLRPIHLALFVAGAPLAWFLGLPAIEFLARLLRRWLAPHVSREDWDAVLYASLKNVVWLAIPGACLWTMWVLGFYFLRVDFVWISFAIGIPAHLLGAAWYFPLSYRWYRLARETAPTDPD